MVDTAVRADAAHQDHVRWAAEMQLMWDANDAAEGLDPLDPEEATR